MASQVGIVNAALTLLGEQRIASIDDDLKPAREAKAIWDISRDALLAGYDWNFAKAREQLSALAGAPAFGYDYRYQLPQKCLRLVMIGDNYAGLDLTNYRGSPTEQYTIEGREILTDLGAPLNIKYVTQVTNTAQFDPCFVKAMACQLAADLAEALTQSDAKRVRAENRLKEEISLAVRANAISLPPKKLADDEWITSRL